MIALYIEHMNKPIEFTGAEIDILLDAVQDELGHIEKGREVEMLGWDNMFNHWEILWGGIEKKLKRAQG